MSEFLPRTGPVASVVSATERGPAVRAPHGVKAADNKLEAGSSPSQTVTDRSTAAADYARIQASIADVLARIRPVSNKTDDVAEAANRSIIALMPSPVIMLPMPPTDPQMVAFVAQVAQSVAERSAQARVAQAYATPIMVEAAAS
jgi:hypothetical protein